MTTDSLSQFQPAVGNGAHQINAAAWAIVLISCFDVGWAGSRTEAAVDAVEEQLVVDPAAGRTWRENLRQRLFDRFRRGRRQSRAHNTHWNRPKPRRTGGPP